VNEGHLRYLASSDWRDYLEADLLPWAFGGVDLGGWLLEVGPGPGLMTDLLRDCVERLVAVEVDPALANALADRLAGTNVEVHCADAAATGLTADTFDLVTCFTMLHHVPSTERQDELFAEICRVLRPGGLLVGTDSLESPDLRAFHADDVYVPVDPATLGARLGAAGFGAVEIEVGDGGPRPGPHPKIRFRATKPA
jgi:SAM-dependent methyltransferase